MTNAVNSRILLKTGTTSDWDKAGQNNFKPLAGEVCIYVDRFKRIIDGQEFNVPGIKIGDGDTPITKLPFIGDEYITNAQINEICEQAIYNSEEVSL